MPNSSMPNDSESKYRGAVKTHILKHHKLKHSKLDSSWVGRLGTPQHEQENVATNRVLLIATI